MNIMLILRPAVNLTVHDGQNELSVYRKGQFKRKLGHIIQNKELTKFRETLKNELKTVTIDMN